PRCPVSRVPALGGPDRGQLILAESVAGKPGCCMRANQGIDFGQPLSRGRRGELAARTGTLLEEVLLPEGPAAEDARGSNTQRQLDLLEIIGKIDARGEQHPGALAGRVQRVQVVLELLFGFVPQCARKFGLVNVAKAAELTG